MSSSQIALGGISLCVFKDGVASALETAEVPGLADQKKLGQLVVGPARIRQRVSHLRRRPIEEGPQSSPFAIFNSAHGP
jgi:hypothetical protein